MDYLLGEMDPGGGAAPFGFKGDDLRQAPLVLGRCMLARIVLEPFGMQPSRRRRRQSISESIFTRRAMPSSWLPVPAWMNDRDPVFPSAR
jgi:hypothetical protein